LLKFAKDRRRWLQWLLEAKKRYGLVVLDYMVTSNHVHLLVVDDGGREVIPRSIQLISGRTGQEFNQRKERKGAFWDDRYHATAVENGLHLLQCLVYIDLNMCRAGVVSHPSEWAFSGYSEIQRPRRKSALIAYDRLSDLAGFARYDDLRDAHRHWVEAHLADGAGVRDSRWSRSIAVGSAQFVVKTKSELGIRAKGRKVVDDGKAYQLREPEVVYQDGFDPESGDIGAGNTYLWNTNPDISR
jgi:putative transposase